MTDAAWAAVRESLPVPAWMEGRGGQPVGYCHRQMIDQCHEVDEAVSEVPGSREVVADADRAWSLR